MVVTNTAGTITYILNADYTLIPHGTLTEIRRVPTGAIANGTTVFVSYQYQNELPIKYGTRDLHGRVTLDLFKHLSLYVNRASSENSLISGTNAGAIAEPGRDALRHDPPLGPGDGHGRARDLRQLIVALHLGSGVSRT